MAKWHDYLSCQLFNLISSAIQSFLCQILQLLVADITCTSSIFSSGETSTKVTRTEFHWTTRSGPLWLLCLVRLHASLVTLFALPAELSYAEPAQIEKHTPMRLMLDNFKLVGPILHTTLGLIFYCNTHRPSLSACSCTSQCLAQKWQIGVNTPFFMAILWS